VTPEAGRPLPAAARPFVGFCRLIREHGFPATSEQTIAFLNAITLLGPRAIGDVYWAARATLAPPIDRLGEFDALFNAAFREHFGVIRTMESAADEETTVSDSGSGALEPIAAEQANESGASATGTEVLALKTFSAASASQRLKAMQRQLAHCAPSRRGYRRAARRTGEALDLRRTLARMVRGGGDSASPARRERRRKLRRVLLLIDISGSMKAHTDDYLRFAHALTQALPAVETFSFGTRLTRLTRSLRHKDMARALAEIAPAVADWQGGTRIAESIETFLAVPRFSRASRGALVVVLSDGLERGDAAPMVHAVRRLASRSWRTAWLTPLAADPDFRPATEALAGILTIVDHLGDGSGLVPLCAFMEHAARLGQVPPAAGRTGEKNHGNARHRRPPSHLAAKRPAVASRADAAAHLRAV
jgi:uncharacterized protein with von Willebrand factor type A (vWA) domain